MSMPCPRPEVLSCSRDEDRLTLGLSDATPLLGSYKGSFQVSRETCRETWLTKMEFAPPIWRDILWALSSDQIRKAWPCDLG